MKICYFGTYEKNYPLNRIIIKGLRKNGIKVVECHISLWEKYKNKHGDFLKLFSLIKLLVNLIIAYLKLGFKFLIKCKNIDTVIVGYIGQLDIFWLNFLILFKKNKPKIIFIPLVSLYDTAIVDRGLSKKNNIFAKLLFYLDKYSFKIADLVIFDTNEHLNYICDLFNLNRNKFKRVWVGADEDVFCPLNLRNDVISAEAGIHDYNKNNTFKVLFIGKYIPLHGLEYIIKAAKLLEEDKNIEFEIIGNGQLDEEVMNLRKELNIKNIDFIEWIEYDELVNEINKADVVLGIFGGTDKSLRVIPNKIFQAVACKKPVITGDSLAIKELFTDKKNILLCENRNAESLRDAILELKSNGELRSEITENSYEVFKEKLTCEKIGERLLKFR